MATPITAAALRDAFDAPEPMTVGLEEEVMLLDPASFELAPRGREMLERLDGDPRFKLELPAAHLEIVTPPLPSVDEAIAELRAGRERLAAAANGFVHPACAAVHPFSPAEGKLNAGERYDVIRAEYGHVAERQLVCALQVHVAVGGADRTLAVYNALRGYLPEIAALAANGPFLEGRDTGLASVRPKIAETLPRQGMPPPIESFEAFAEELRWGAAAGAVPEPGSWWWELRPLPLFGTLALRVPDAQTTIADAEAVAAFAHALVQRLAERHDAGDELGVPATWRIEENRWSACRHGVEGEMADVRTGERRSTREWLLEVAEEVGAEGARPLARRNGAVRQREVAEEQGMPGLARWLADSFSPPG